MSEISVSRSGSSRSEGGSLGPIIHTHGPGEQVKLTWVDRTGTHTATLQLMSGPAV